MSTIVLEVSNSTMTKIQNHYIKATGEAQPPGSLFLAKISDCTITGYKSGKVMFQGKGSQREAEQWQSSALKENKQKAKRQPSHEWAPPSNIENQSIIGSDEVGTGNYFGPMTVAAAFVHSEKIPLLKELGVKDSKYLSDETIKQIARDLIHTIPYSLLVLHNEKYNELQQAGMSQGKMKAMLHNRALLNVIAKLRGTAYDGILIDQFAIPDVYFRYLANEQEVIKDVYFSTRAEAVHLSVAAASIIARYSFLTEMDSLNEQIGIILPKGAGNQVDEAAATIIATKGKHLLERYTKLHFANTQKALKLAEQKKH